jgi:hypothetical protein
MVKTRGDLAPWLQSGCQILALAACLLTCSCQDPKVIAFFAAATNSAAVPPADGIYPNGRKLAFMGYSGEPARDLTNGFTVAGPVYGNQMPYLQRCFSNHWPVVAHVGPHITFNDKSPDKYKVNEVALREEVQRQVRELAGHPEVIWWAVHPEELRPWRGDEMKYLAIVSDTVRKTDPLKRPLYLYNPNNRDAGSLKTIAQYTDVIGKGCYVNSCGKKRDRAWVRWSVEQEIEGARLAGRTNAVPLIMPELCRDPEPAEDKEVRDWVRHDVYLGLCSGARGVLIWSLFRRGEVRRTWPLWYNAYAECGRELNGPRGLAGVFLFGEPRTDLAVRLLDGAAEVKVGLGGDAEPDTTSAEERAKRTVKGASWTKAEFVYGNAHWLFLVNSANQPAEFSVTGWPRRCLIENAFSGEATQCDRITLPAYGVLGIRASCLRN